jgi:radical SAM superfamily enzyme YgiQ (UPF0313 family)
MKIGLIFPPPFDLTQPYLSLPMLASFLKRRGHTVVQRDLNLAFYDRVLSRSYLLQAHEAARDIATQGSMLDEDPEWLNLLDRAVTLGPLVADQIDNAKAELRNSIAFYDPKRYARNFRLIHRGCDMLSAIFPPSRITPVSYTMGYGMESLADILEASKSEKRNPFAAVFTEHFVPELAALQLELVGISVVYSDQIIPALTLARLLKEASPMLPIVIGGEVFSKMLRLPEVRLAPLFEFVDGFVLDDGRRPLAALCDGTPLEEIPGIVTRNRSEPISRMPAPLESIDSFGAPDFSDLPMTQYFAPPHVMPLLGGKGCQYSQCLFCSESYAKDYAPQSIDLVVAAIEKLVREHGARGITFADVDIPPDRLSALADRLIERRIEVTWSCYARLTSRMDQELLAKIAQAGCRRIYFGFESASQRILKLMRKGTQIARVPEILRACWASGISPHLFSFVGFPGETREEAALTADFFVAHCEHIGSFNIGAFAFQTFSGLYAEAEAFGVESTRTRAAEGDAMDHPYRVRGGMDMDEVLLLAAELTQSAYERIAKVDGSFQIYTGSNYVSRAGVPPWNSHSLAYLSHHGHSFNSMRGGVVEIRTGYSEIPIKADYVELDSEGDGGALIFNPTTAKLLMLKPRFLELLKSCNGKNSIEEILERAARDGVASNHAIRALNQALREDLVTLVAPNG